MAATCRGWAGWWQYAKFSPHGITERKRRTAFFSWGVLLPYKLISFTFKQYLGWIKEWICSNGPITTCGTVKAWLSQGSGIWPTYHVARRERPMRALVLFTLQRNLLVNMRRTWLFRRSQPVQLRLTGWFHIHMFLLSKAVLVRTLCRKLRANPKSMLTF